MFLMILVNTIVNYKLFPFVFIRISDRKDRGYLIKSVYRLFRKVSFLFHFSKTCKKQRILKENKTK